MAFWANLLGYQATWFLVVWSAGRGQAWMGLLACVVFIVSQLLASHRRAADLRVLTAALACGLIVDGLAASAGWLRYASPAPALPAPAWIVLLWGAFAMTLNHSMQWFASHRWLAAVFAAVGGPLAYASAARGFDAVAFPDPAWPTLIALAIAWAIALPVLMQLAAGGRVRHPAAAEAFRA